MNNQVYIRADGRSTDLLPKISVEGNFRLNRKVFHTKQMISIKCVKSQYDIILYHSGIPSWYIFSCIDDLNMIYSDLISHLSWNFSPRLCRNFFKMTPSWSNHLTFTDHSLTLKRHQQKTLIQKVVIQLNQCHAKDSRWKNY